MTKAEIIEHAARELGDTSTDFKDQVVKPAFELVLQDLAQSDCLDLKRTATFKAVSGQRTYSVREICGGGVHHAEVLEINAYVWGCVVPRCDGEAFTKLRLSLGETATGRFQGWRQFPNRETIEFAPPVGADDDGAELQVVFEADPLDIVDDDDVTLVMRREIPALIAGIKWRCALFTQETTAIAGQLAAEYEAAKMRMYGRLHNDKPRKVSPTEGYW